MFDFGYFCFILKDANIRIATFYNKYVRSASPEQWRNLLDAMKAIPVCHTVATILEISYEKFINDD